jgi:excisionase family DNA binding protein
MRYAFDPQWMCAKEGQKGQLEFLDRVGRSVPTIQRRGSDMPPPQPSASNAVVERLAFSPDEVAEALGISRELVNDLLRTGQLGSVKAGRRRLIGKHHLEAFLAREQ